MQEVLNVSEERLNRREELKKEGWTMERMGVGLKDLRKRGRENAIAKAKAVISYYAIKELGIKGGEISRLFRCSNSAINRLALIGEQIVEKDGSILLF